MKIYDIVREDSDIEEAPVGMLKRAGQAVAGKVSAAAAAKGESSKEANQVFKDLKIWAARGELDLKNLPVDKFKSFMQKKGYDNQLDQQISKFTDPNDSESALGKKQIEQIVLAQTRDAATDNARVQKGKYAKGSEKQAGKKDKSGAGSSSQDLKQVAQTVKKMSDKEKQQLAKLL